MARPAHVRGAALAEPAHVRVERDAAPAGYDAGDRAGHAVARRDLARIGLVALAVGLSWSGVWRRVVGFDAVALLATLAGGYPIFHEALSALWARRMTMELSMTIALAAALAIGEYFTALVIVLFVLVAEVLEHLTVGRGRQAIRDLLDVLPRRVVVRRGGAAQDVAAEAVAAGDVVVVGPGACVPVDGVVTGGHSFVDEATITGESMPVEKVSGARVFAGTLNQSGVLDVRTTGIGRDTAFATIIEAVERAERSRAPIQKTADRLAGYLVYFAIGAALVTFAVTRDIRATISVVIVAGACGIAAGTPLAILGAIGRAARQGAIVKGGLYVEVLGRVDMVVLDKTGTLTLGTPEVVGVHPVVGVSQSHLIETAAIAERPSEHPLGKAIVKRAALASLAAAEPDRFEYTPGVGIVCTFQGETIAVGSRGLIERQGAAVDGVDAAATGVWVARGGRLLGALEIADVVRPEAGAAVAALKRMGLRTLLLTGDGVEVARRVGAQLGVDEVHAETLPEQKLEKVKSLQGSGCTVAMVGDGINDAPALAQAEVGIAMGSGTDVARESADVVLLGSDLLKLVESLRIARRCRRIIRQNFVGTLLVDGAGVLLAAAGALNPLAAAFIHVTSELVFILNSARLLPGAASSVELTGSS